MSIKITAIEEENNQQTSTEQTLKEKALNYLHNSVNKIELMLSRNAKAGYILSEATMLMGSTQALIELCIISTKETEFVFETSIKVALYVVDND